MSNHLIMSKTEIVLIVGLPGSGKSLAASTMHELGWHIISAGDIIRNLCVKEGLSTDRETLQKFGENLLKSKGNKYFAQLLMDNISNYERVVIEGIRPVNVINIIKKTTNCTLIYIDANKNNRFHRLIDRDHLGQTAFSNIEKRLLERQVVTSQKLADIVIINNGSVEAFLNEVKKISSAIKREEQHSSGLI